MILIEEAQLVIFHKIVHIMMVDYYNILTNFSLHYIYNFEENRN